MDLTVSLKSDKPIYEQLYDQIVAQILNGKLKPDEMLPSIRNVACELSISVITVKNAWDLLAQNGFIYSVGGKGCFVSPMGERLEDKKSLLALDKLKKDIEFYKGLGLTAEDLKKLIDENY